MMGKLRNFWQRKIVKPIIDLLKRGITPEKIVLSIAFGVTIGVIPVLGTTTILCALVAIIFRLNLTMIQLVNYLVYPLQLILLIPFYRAGEILFSSKALSLSVEQVVSMFNQDFEAAVKFLWITTLHAVAVWGIIAPLVIAILYFGLLPVIRQLPFKYNTSQSE